MNQMQFESKCCGARVFQDTSYENDETETENRLRFKCSKCGKIVDEVTLSKRSKRLR